MINEGEKDVQSGP